MLFQIRACEEMRHGSVFEERGGLALIKGSSDLNCPQWLIITKTIRRHGLPGPGIELGVEIF